MGLTVDEIMARAEGRGRRSIGGVGVSSRTADDILSSSFDPFGAKENEEEEDLFGGMLGGLGEFSAPTQQQRESPTPQGESPLSGAQRQRGISAENSARKTFSQLNANPDTAEVLQDVQEESEPTDYIEPVFDMLTGSSYGINAFIMTMLEGGDFDEGIRQAGIEYANALPGVEYQEAKRPSWGQYLDEKDVFGDGTMGTVGAMVAGFVLDVGLDPLTYVPIVGKAKAAGRIGKLLGMSNKTAQTAARITRAVSSPVIGAAAELGAVGRRADGSVAALSAASNLPFIGEGAGKVADKAGEMFLPNYKVRQYGLTSDEAGAEVRKFLDQERKLKGDIDEGMISIQETVNAISGNLTDKESLLFMAYMDQPEKLQKQVGKLLADANIGPGTPEYKEVFDKVESFRSLFKEWGEEEVKEGVLSQGQVLSHYAPANNPLTKKSERMWKKLVERGFIGDKELAEIDGVHIKPGTIGLQTAGFAKSKLYKTIEERIYAGLPTELDLAKSTMKRGMEHVRAVQSRRFLRSVVDDSEVMRRVDMTDMSEEAFSAIHKTQEAQGYVALDISKMSEAKNIQDVSKVGEVVFMPKEFADHLQTAEGLMQGDGIANQVWGTMKTMQGIWKGYALLSPGYHMRNLYSNVYQNFLAGVTDPRRYAQAMALQSNGTANLPTGVRHAVEGLIGKKTMDDVFLHAGDVPMTGNDLLKSSKELGVYNSGVFAKDMTLDMEMELLTNYERQSRQSVLRASAMSKGAMTFRDMLSNMTDEGGRSLFDEDRADVLAQIADARANTFAWTNGKTADEWWDTRIKKLRYNGTPGEGALHQVDTTKEPTLIHQKTDRATGRPTGKPEKFYDGDTDDPVMLHGENIEGPMANLFAEIREPTAEDFKRLIDDPNNPLTKSILNLQGDIVDYRYIKQALRTALDDSGGAHTWYVEYGRGMEKLVGEKNMPELSAVWAHLSAQNNPEDNLSDALHVMSTVREMTRDGAALTIENFRHRLGKYLTPELDAKSKGLEAEAKTLSTKADDIRKRSSKLTNADKIQTQKDEIKALRVRARDLRAEATTYENAERLNKTVSKQRTKGEMQDQGRVIGKEGRDKKAEVKAERAELSKLMNRKTRPPEVTARIAELEPIVKANDEEVAMMASRSTAFKDDVKVFNEVKEFGEKIVSRSLAAKVSEQDLEALLRIYTDGAFSAGMMKTNTFAMTTWMRHKLGFFPFSVNDVHMARPFGYGEWVKGGAGAKTELSRSLQEEGAGVASRDVEKGDPFYVSLFPTSNAGQDQYRFVQYMTAKAALDVGISVDEAQAALWWYSRTRLSPNRETGKMYAHVGGQAGWGQTIGTFPSAKQYSAPEIARLQGLEDAGHFTRDRGLGNFDDFQIPFDTHAYPVDEAYVRALGQTIADEGELITIASKHGGFGVTDKDVPLAELEEFHKKLWGRIMDKGPDGKGINKIKVLSDLEQALGFEHTVEPVAYGTWTGLEPNFQIRIRSKNPDIARAVAGIMGDAFQQEAAIVSTPRALVGGQLVEMAKTGAIEGKDLAGVLRLVKRGDGTAFSVDDLKEITKAVNPTGNVDGFQFGTEPGSRGIRFLNFKFPDDTGKLVGKEDEKFFSEIGDLLKKAGLDAKVEGQTYYHAGAYHGKKDYAGLIKGLRVDLGGGGLKSSDISRRIYSQLHKPFAEEFQAAAARSGDAASWKLSGDSAKHFDRVASASAPEQATDLLSELGRTLDSADTQSALGAIGDAPAGTRKLTDRFSELSDTPGAKEILYQGGSAKAKGAVTFAEDGGAIIDLFENADASTVIHELAHIIRRNDLSDVDSKAIEKWVGVKDGAWDVAAEEKFADGFERYIRQGETPVKELNGAFEKMKVWMESIYDTLTGTRLGKVRISQPVRDTFDRLLGSELPAIPSRVNRLTHELGDLEVGTSMGEIASRTLGRGSRLLRGNRRIGGAMENNSKIAHFLDKTEKMGAVAKGEGASTQDVLSNAAQSTRKYLFDYDELTPFERDFMRQVIPFYTWMRKNIPLQMQAIMEDPGRYAKVPKFINNVENMTRDWRDAQEPDYFKDLHAVRVPALFNGNPTYLNPNLPFQDLNNLNAKDIAGAMTPWAKILGEWYPERGYSFFLDRPVERYPGEPSDLLPFLTKTQEQGLSTIAPPVGKLLRFARDMDRGEGKLALINEALGLKLKSVSQQDQRRSKAYKNKRIADTAKRRAEALGLKVRGSKKRNSSR
tara:strand:- start:4196 stop:10831 length:6636 start_codon:yes stop_codon:yes gene_type:complete